MKKTLCLFLLALAACSPQQPPSATPPESSATSAVNAPNVAMTLSSEQAMDLVAAIPEVAGWRQAFAAQKYAPATAAMRLDMDAAQTVDGASYWSISFYANYPDRLERWQGFMVRLDGKEILAEDIVNASYIPLAQWQTQQKQNKE